MSKVCAVWLIALIVLPFTAPFPTCDFADLLGRVSTHEEARPSRSGASSPVIDDSSLLFPPPIATQTQRAKTIGLSRVKNPAMVVLLAPLVPVTHSASASVGPEFLQYTVLRI